MALHMSVSSAPPIRDWTDIDSYTEEKSPLETFKNVTDEVVQPSPMKVPLYMEIIATSATIANLLLFIAPISTMKEMLIQKSVGSYSPLPYIFTFTSCSFWATYCFDLGDRLAPGIVNAIGLFLNSIYIMLFLYCMRQSPDKTGLINQLSIQFGVFGSIIGGSFLLSPIWRSGLLGSLAACLCLMAYASPLAVIRIVVETGSVRYMPLPLSLAVFAASGSWALYGYLKHDQFLFIPNAVGCILGAIQLFVYAIVYVRFKQNQDIISAIREAKTPLPTGSTCNLETRKARQYGALSLVDRDDPDLPSGLLRRHSKSLIKLASLSDLTQELSYWERESSIVIPSFDSDSSFVRRVSTESSFVTDEHPFEI